MEQHPGRAVGLFILFDGFEPVEFGIDFHQTGHVPGAEIAAAGGFGDAGEHGLVEFRRGVDRSRPEKGALGDLVGADADGVDLDVLAAGQLPGLFRRHFAGVVDAVGEQDEHPAVLGAAAQMDHRQADGVADGGGRFLDDADVGLFEQFADNLAVESQRRLDIGVGGEEDQPEPVPLAALDEVPHHGFDHIDARGLAAADDHVLGFHAAGDIDREHQVAAGRGQLHRLAEPLRPARREHHEQPDQRAENQLEQPARAQIFAVGVEPVERVEERHIQRGVLARRPGHQPVDEEGQRQQRERPGPNELKHRRGQPPSRLGPGSAAVGDCRAGADRSSGSTPG